MEKLRVELNGLSLSMQGPEKIERLGIRSSYPADESSRTLFASLGTMHLVGRHLPRTIQTNFAIPQPIQELIGAMYRSQGKNPPALACSSEIQEWIPPAAYWPEPPRVAVAYSAGKDSMWNLWRAIERYGVENILVIHVRGLNKNNGSNEYQYTLRQQKKFPFQHLTVIDLLNSSTNTGYKTMVSRDMFLAGLAIPHALAFGATKIITEGFKEETPDEPFSGLEKNMTYFNGILSQLRVRVRVAWWNRSEQDIVRDLYRHRPRWMPHLCNCFSIPNRKAHLRDCWAHNAPTIKLYDSQCGSCIKCRIVNLARLELDPACRNVRREDVVYFLKNTDTWMRSPDNIHIDMITPSFLRDYRRMCRQYGVVPKSAV